MKNNSKFIYFKISWIILLITAVCDYSIADKLTLGFFSVNVQASSIGLLIYLIVFMFSFPLKKITELISLKYDRYNLGLLMLLLILAYISSYFSLMQKYALVTTTSRYLLLFIALILTLIYSKYYEESVKFIIKTFIYINLFVAISSLAEYYIPGFYRILVDKFGVMESKHAVMRIGSITYMRPSGFITDANLAAFTPAISSLLLFLNRKNFPGIFIYSFYIITGIVSGMLSSRSAFIIAIFSIIIFLILKKTDWKNALIYFLLFIAVQFSAPQTQARFFNITDSRNKIEEMEHGRPLVWKADYLAMQEKPFIGLGSGVFFKQSEIYIARVEEKIDEEKYRKALSDPGLDMMQGINPHNIFFTMQIEYGIGGTILFIILVIFNIVYLVKNKKFIALTLALGILFASSLSNYAPYYKYYLLVIIVFYILVHADLKIQDNV